MFGVLSKINIKNYGFYIVGIFFAWIGFYLTSQSYNGSEVITWNNESNLYFDNAKKVMEGKTPFFDYFVEYPPFVPYLLSIPALLTFNPKIDGAIYLFAYPALMMLISFFVYFFFIKEKLKVDLFWIVVFLINFMIGATYIITRYDFYPAVTCFLGMLFYIKSNQQLEANSTKTNFISSVFFLCLSAFLKVYAIFPLFLIFLLSLKDKFRLKVIVITIILFGLSQIPFALTSNFARLVEYQTVSRDAQLESTYAGVSLLAEHYSLTPRTNLAGQNGSMELNDSFSKSISKASTYFLILLVIVPILVFGYTSYKKNNSNTDQVIYLFIAVILGVLVSSKIFSPQYWFWILGLLPLLSYLKNNAIEQKFQNIILAVVITLITYLTYWIWPSNYGLLMDKEFNAILVLNFRNLLCVILYFYFIIKSFKFNN
jgi:hypothetical protein